MNPQAQADANSIYDPVTQAIQGQAPAIQNLYSTLLQGLQQQGAVQQQNVVNSAALRGVGTPGIANDTATMLHQAIGLQGAQLGQQQAQDMAAIGQQVGKANVGRAQAAGDFTGAYQKQAIENQSNQMQMTDLERKAQAEQLANQRNFEINKIQYQTAQAQANAERAKAASDAASKMSMQAFVGNVEAALVKSMGGDKHVSPQDFKAGLNLWTQRGLPAAEYFNSFKEYINPSHIQDYVR